MDNNKIPASVSIILPCYNESKNIIKHLRYNISVLDNVFEDYEVIVVNDGSTDKSKIILQQFINKNSNNIKLISHSSNLGYGKALRNGFKKSSKELILYIDTDNQYDISQVKKFFPYIYNSDMIFGYRINRKDSFFRNLVAKYYNFFIRSLTGREIVDIDCSFKLFQKSKLLNLNLKSNQFFIDTEIFLKSIKQNYSIMQLPVNHYPRTKGKSTVTPKKILLTFFEMIAFCWRYKIS